MMTLRNNTGMPPGGIIYEDPRTIGAKWTDDHTFLDERVAEIIKFRSANLSVYPEAQWTEANFVRQQVVDFNCQRLGNDPNYCLDVAQYNQPVPPAPAPRLCPDCGVAISPIFCPTCAGRRITSYECPSCKKEFPL